MNSSNPRRRQLNNQTDGKKNRKKSLLILSILVGSITAFVIVALICVGLMSKNEEDSGNKNPTYIFHEADYDYDIMRDPQYLQLDRQVYFSNPETGITLSIDKNNYIDVPNDQKEYVLLLYDFIDYAIAGKSEELNSLFSEEYIKADGKTKLDFTMQQLYNIKITYVQMLEEVVDGNTVTSYDYWLEYMIRNNNGTFRNDMESDCIRKEYVRVSKRGERLGIDVLAPYRTDNKPNDIMSAEEIIKISIIATITMGVALVGVGIMLKRKK